MKLANGAAKINGKQRVIPHYFVRLGTKGLAFKRRQGDPHLGEINLISRRFTILGSVAANPWISRREQKSGEDTWPGIRCRFESRDKRKGDHIGTTRSNRHYKRRDDLLRRCIYIACYLADRVLNRIVGVLCFHKLPRSRSPSRSCATVAPVRLQFILI